MKRIVVFGGGVGGSKMSKAILGIPEITTTTCLTNTTDNGGHSGEIRRRLGIIPPGDLRRVICNHLDSSVRRLYEFRDQDGVVGNRVLAEMIIARGVVNGIRAFVSIFKEFPGDRFNVWPVSATPTDLCMDVDGTTYRGQIRTMFERPVGSFGNLWLDPEIEILSEAKEAIEQADLIIIAPSGIVGSVAPILLAKGMKDLIANKRLVWFAPLFSLPMDGPNPWKKYKETIVRLVGKETDLIVANSDRLPVELERLYREKGFNPIVPGSEVRTFPLLGEIPMEPPGVLSTPLPRYFIHVQHDVEMVRRAIQELLPEVL